LRFNALKKFLACLFEFCKGYDIIIYHGYHPVNEMLPMRRGHQKKKQKKTGGNYMK
jgi:hypothetical protein